MVHIANGVPLYSLRHEDAISILFSMKCWKVAKGWTFYVGNTSGVLIETIYMTQIYINVYLQNYQNNLIAPN